MQYCYNRKTFHVNALIIYLLAGIAGLNTGVNSHAAGSPAGYDPPLLKAPYTLVFSVKNVDVAKEPPVVDTPKVKIYSGDPLAQQSDSPLKLTFSNNGHRVLYLLESGNLKTIIICDIDQNVVYSYRSGAYNAIVKPGALQGVLKMGLLPMPGVGYDVYPMFRSFSQPASGVAHADMARIGAVLTGPDGRFLDLRYDDVLVRINSKTSPITLDSCVRHLPDAPEKISDYWTFSGITSLGSVPISKETVHVLYKPAVTHIQSEQSAGPNGTTTGTYTTRIDPASPMVVDRKTTYTLSSATQSALPPAEYNLEFYLPANCVINDLRKRVP